MQEKSGTIFAVMSGVSRKGDWDPPEHLHVFACMGGVELDFRDAVLLKGVTEVDAFAVMGGVKIIVPDDIDVETEGSGVMGGFETLDHRTGDPDAPLLRITGFALMGGVEIKLVPI